MNGCSIPRTPICVDFWKVPTHMMAHRVFFLSHMHMDHTAGLTPSWRYPIYCSEITGKLIQARFDIRPDLIKTLAINQSHLIPLNKDNSDTMTVTLIDANHCPGSAVFIFEGYFGRIVYTADFRYTPSMFTSTLLTELCNNSADGTRKPVDVLYLYNTYCNPGCVFPLRDESKCLIFDIIDKHPDHNVVLGVSGSTLGKEDLLVELALHYKTWITVSPKRYETLNLLGMPDVFKTYSLGFIAVEPRFRISKSNMAKWNEKSRTIAILVTALYTGLKFQPFVNQDDVYIVPYSDHSSYLELCEFVSFIRPRKIRPIVPANTKGPHNTEDRANMSCFDKYRDPSPSPTFEIPKWLWNGESRYAIEKKIAGINKAGRKRPQMRKRVSLPSAKGVVYDDDNPQDKKRTLLRKWRSDSNAKSLEFTPSGQNSNGISEMNVACQYSATEAGGRITPTRENSDNERVYVLRILEDSPTNTEDTITVQILDDTDKQRLSEQPTEGAEGNKRKVQETVDKVPVEISNQRCVVNENLMDVKNEPSYVSMNSRMKPFEGHTRKRVEAMRKNPPDGAVCKKLETQVNETSISKQPLEGAAGTGTPSPSGLIKKKLLSTEECVIDLTMDDSQNSCTCSSDYEILEKESNRVTSSKDVEQPVNLSPKKIKNFVKNLIYAKKLQPQESETSASKQPLEGATGTNTLSPLKLRKQKLQLRSRISVGLDTQKIENVKDWLDKQMCFGGDRKEHLTKNTEECVIDLTVDDSKTSCSSEYETLEINRTM